MHYKKMLHTVQIQSRDKRLATELEFNIDFKRMPGTQQRDHTMVQSVEHAVHTISVYELFT